MSQLNLPAALGIYMTNSMRLQLSCLLCFAMSACAQSFEVLSSQDASFDGGVPEDAPVDIGPDFFWHSTPYVCFAPAFHICAAACADGMGSERKYLWNGSGCTEFCANQCVGTACSWAYNSEEACLTAHSVCKPSVCERTGGAWDSRAQCAYRCGARNTPSLENGCGAAAPAADCACPVGQTFSGNRGGCVDDPTCDDVDLCRGSGGTFAGYYLGGSDTPVLQYVECGDIIDMTSLSDAEFMRVQREVAPGCDCGHGGTFSPTTHRCEYTNACRAQASTENDDEYAEQLCVHSGGSWEGAPRSGNTMCGEIIPDRTNGGCNCGLAQSFDPERGCRDNPACFQRTRGQSCSESGQEAQCTDPDAYCEVGTPDTSAGTCSVDCGL